MDQVGEETLEVMKGASWYNKWLFAIMKPHLGKKVLEVGAGIGNFTEYLSSVSEVTAVDINDKYVDKLKEKLGKKVQVGYGDIEKGKYFFKNAEFNSVVCLNVLEHVQRDSAALKYIYELLAPKGKLVLLVPAHQLLFSELDEGLGHFHRYEKGSLETKLKKIGFKIVRIQYLNWWGAIGWFWFLKVMRKKQMPRGPVAIFDILGRIFLIPEKVISFPFGLSVLAIVEK